MKVTFLGAAHEVTGSCTLLEVGDKKGVIDCGMEQGKDLFENQELPVAASVLDFALVTHAHVDHSGLLPLLYKNGFRGTVYATGATCSLLDIMLRDCAHIQMADAEWKSRKAMRRGEAAVEPLYDLDDVAGLMKLLHPCEYGSQVQVNESVTIRFTDVGHLLGSAAIEIWLKEGDCEKKIVFSGDIGNLDQPILCDPKHIDKTDYLVIESTYGDRNHADKQGLIAWLEGFSEKPELVFVNHGDPESADSFTACLNNELGYRAFAPYSGTEFDIAAGRFTVVTQGRPIVKTPKAPSAERRVNPLFTELLNAADALMQAVRGCEGRSNRDLRAFTDAVRKLTDKIKR